jgi:hypothetical protein
VVTFENTELVLKMDIEIICPMKGDSRITTVGRKIEK